MRTARGFTIIEIMITVVIIAVLATIAVPSYTDYIARSKIPEATSNLLAMRVKLEQYFQDARTYTNACAAGTIATPPTLKYFTITCPTANDTQYTIHAEGGVTGADQSMVGFAFEINEQNARTTTAVPSAAWGTAPVNCWVSKKGGTC